MRSHMNVRTILQNSMFALMLGSGVAMAADDMDADRSQPGTFVKDSAITAKVKAKLTADHMSNLARVHVDTDANGIVWLTGTVESPDVASRAVSLAKSTDGVRGVHDDIKVAK